MSPQQQVERTTTRHEDSTDDQDTGRTGSLSAFPYRADELTVFPYGPPQRGSTSLRVPAPGPDDCPDCGETAVNAQGALDCPACDWSETR